jgi:hypothetical protein
MQHHVITRFQKFVSTSHESFKAATLPRTIQYPIAPPTMSDAESVAISGEERGTKRPRTDSPTISKAPAQGTPEDDGKPTAHPRRATSR